MNTEYEKCVNFKENLKKLEKKLIDNLNEKKETEKELISGLSTETDSKINKLLEELQSVVKENQNNLNNDLYKEIGKLYNLITIKREECPNDVIFWENEHAKNALDDIILKQEKLKQESKEENLKIINEYKEKVYKLIENEEKINISDNEKIKNLNGQINKTIEEINLAKSKINTDINGINICKSKIDLKDINGEVVEIPICISANDFTCRFIRDVSLKKETYFEYISMFVLKSICENDCNNINLNLVDMSERGTHMRRLIDLKKLKILKNNAIYLSDSQKTQFLMKLDDLLSKRASDLGTKTYEEYNKEADVKLSKEVFVIDSYRSVFDDRQDLLKEIVTNGKRYGIYCILIENDAGVSNNKVIYRSEEEIQKREEILEQIIKDVFSIELKKNNGKVELKVNGKEIYIDLIDFSKETFLKQYNEVAGIQEKAKEKMKKESEVSVEDLVEKLPDMGKFNTEKEIKLPVGLDAKKEVVYLTIDDDHPHSMLIGTTGAGKSNLFHNILLSAMEMYSESELQFYVLDLKHGAGFVPYSRYYTSNIKGIFITEDKNKCETVLDFVLAEAERRIKFIRNEGAISGEITEYRITTHKKMPRIVFLIDEFQNILKSKELKDKFEKILKMCRAAGIHILMCSQDADMTILDEKSKHLIKNRIVIQVYDKTSKDVLSQGNKSYDEFADVLKTIASFQRGEGFINDEWGDIEANKKFKTPYMTPEYKQKMLEDISNYNKENGGSRPPVISDDIKNMQEFVKAYKESDNMYLKKKMPTILIGERIDFNNSEVAITFNFKNEENFVMNIENKAKRLAIFRTIFESLKIWNAENGREKKAKVYVIDFARFDEELKEEYDIDFTDIENAEDKEDVLRKKLEEIEQNDKTYNFVVFNNLTSYSQLRIDNEGIEEIVSILKNKNIVSFAVIEKMDEFADNEKKLVAQFNMTKNYILDFTRNNISNQPNSVLYIPYQYKEGNNNNALIYKVNGSIERIYLYKGKEE